jgi:hypothetical protein
MTKSIPIVQDGFVVDDHIPGPTLYLDTRAWVAWLEAPTTTRFSYALFNRAQGYIDGFMTVRKERRQRGAAYWSVYRRQGPRLRKVYVGPSTALTQARLEQIAAQLRPRDGPAKNHTFLWMTQLYCLTDRPSKALLIFKPEFTPLADEGLFSSASAQF